MLNILITYSVLNCKMSCEHSFKRSFARFSVAFIKEFQCQLKHVLFGVITVKCLGQLVANFMSWHLRQFINRL